MTCRVFTATIVCLVCATLLLGCSGSGPTAATPAGAAEGAPSVVGLAEPSSLLEQVDCSVVDEVFVRFSAPGFLDGRRVGLYVNFTGLPEGERILRLWWDYEGAFDATEDVRLDDGSVDRIDGRLVYERVIEHSYEPVALATTRKVRAELILPGKTGNCARNRSIVLRPAGPTTEGELEGRPCEGGPCKVFVTSARYDGALGGLEGADSRCQESAIAAGLQGRFRAWLSDGSASPASRFSRAGTAYVLVDGTRIASGWADLVKGSIAHHIDVTERGTAALGVSTVWTRTRPDGTAVDFGLGPDCEGWTSASKSGYGTNGQYQGNIGLWSFLGASSCNASLRLYCFQQ